MSSHSLLAIGFFGTFIQSDGFHKPKFQDLRNNLHLVLCARTFGSLRIRRILEDVFWIAFEVGGLVFFALILALRVVDLLRVSQRSDM